jgi:hypothetical protein
MGKERANQIKEGATRRFSTTFSRTGEQHKHGYNDGRILQVVKSGIIWLQNEKVGITSYL